MIALAYFVLIGVSLWVGWGLFQPVPVALVSAGLLAYGVTVAQRRTPARRSARPAVLLVCFLVMVTATAIRPLVAWAGGPSLAALEAILWCAPVGGALMAIALISHRSSRSHRIWALGLFVALVGLVVPRCVVIVASPAPFIDTFYWGQAASDYVLGGTNPYGAEYWDMYGQVWGISYGYDPGFHYWPGWLGWATLWSTLVPGAHDVRVGLIAADLLAAACVFGIALRLRLGGRVATLAGLLWLGAPSGLLVVGQAWADPVSVMALLGGALAVLHRRWVLAGLILGFACATKQYVLLATAFTLLYVLRAEGLRAMWRVAVPCAITWVALLAPFALADWDALVASTVLTFVHSPARQDAFTLVAFFGQGLSVEAFTLHSRPFTWASLACLAGLLAWACHPRVHLSVHRWFGMTALAYGAAFLLGKQAFCNYYYFLGAFVLVDALTGWAPEAEDDPARVREPARAEPPTHSHRFAPRWAARALRFGLLFYCGVLIFGLLRFVGRDGVATTPTLTIYSWDGSPPLGVSVRASSYDTQVGHHPLFVIDGEPHPTSLERWVPDADDPAPWIELVLDRPVDVTAVGVRFDLTSTATTNWPGPLEASCFSEPPGEAPPGASTQLRVGIIAGEAMFPFTCRGARRVRLTFAPHTAENPVWLDEFQLSEVAP